MTPAEKQNLASDFILGTLDDSARAQAERLMSSDPVFARTVQEGRQRLSEFDLSAEPVTPQPALWSRIETALTSSPAPADNPAMGWGTRLWNNLNAWRAIGLAAAATAMLLAVGLGFAVREAQRTPAMIAVLVDGNKAGAVVHVFNDGRAVLLPLTDIAVPADRALQVWTLPSRERGPVSIGLMQRAHTLALSLRDIPAPNPNQLFEITLEPKGGSPTGRPTGPILFKGLTAPTI